jgi:hypothetical protein
VTVTFGVADATNLTGYEGRFDTVVDSALYQLRIGHEVWEPDLDDCVPKSRVI